MSRITAPKLHALYAKAKEGMCMLIMPACVLALMANLASLNRVRKFRLMRTLN